MDELDTYRDASTCLASLLGSHHLFNWWDKASRERPHEWTEKQLKECDGVVFICTPRGKLALERLPHVGRDWYMDSFALTYNRVVKNDKYDVTCVYFDETRDCIPEKLKNRKIFRLPEKMKSFLQQANGHSVAQCEKGKIDYLLLKVDDIRKKAPCSLEEIKSPETAPLCDFLSQK